MPISPSSANAVPWLAERVARCADCEYHGLIRGEPCCALIRCCGADDDAPLVFDQVPPAIAAGRIEPQWPSPTTYRLMLSAANGRCPHPQGSRWPARDGLRCPGPAVQASESNPAPPPGAIIEMVNERARTCLGCEHRTPQWGCTKSGGAFVLNLLLVDTWRCPVGKF